MASLRVALCSTQLTQRTNNISQSVPSNSRLFHVSSCQQGGHGARQNGPIAKAIVKATSPLLFTALRVLAKVFPDGKSADKLKLHDWVHTPEGIEFGKIVNHPANPNSPYAEWARFGQPPPYHSNEQIPFVNGPPPLSKFENPGTPLKQNALFYGGVGIFVGGYLWADYMEWTETRFGDLDWDAIRAERNAEKDEDDEDDEDEDEEAEEEEEEE